MPAFNHIKRNNTIETLDRIFVKDYTVDIEIGAFQSEVGCKQKVKFNVILEVTKNPAILDDNVDKILSYETILEAIWSELNSKRFNLLETLAEHVAGRCLMEEKAERVVVKIEKLDKIKGSLGIEISRDKNSLEKSGYQVLGQKDLKRKKGLILVHLTSSLISSESIESWLKVFKNSEKPVVISLDPLDSINFENVCSEVQTEVILLSMAQNAVLFDNLFSMVSIVRNKAELESTIKIGRIAVLSPTKIIEESVSTAPSVNMNAKDLAIQLAEEISATRVIFIGDPRLDDCNDFGHKHLQVDHLTTKEWMKF